jgi:Transposase and inactivated derivatives, IS30 family
MLNSPWVVPTRISKPIWRRIPMYLSARWTR